MECPICQEPIKDIHIVLKCKHVFCYQCWSNYKTRDRCPMCRAPVACLEWEKDQSKSWEEVQKEEFSQAVMQDLEEEEGDMPMNVVLLPIDEFMRRLAVVTSMSEEEQIRQIQEFYDRLRQ